MNTVESSEALHARVRAFAASGATTEAFDELALSIARFQARCSPAFARLVAEWGSALDQVDGIPSVPTDAFRLTRVAVHPAELDSVCFTTSGTTASQRGQHALRTTQTYAEVALRFGRSALLLPATRVTAVALAALPALPWTSSLGFMLELFMRHFDGRALDGSGFRERDGERFLLSAAGPDVRGLEAAVQVALARGEPLLLLSTSLALAALLEALEGRPLPLPPGSVVMHTGGYKGQHRQVLAEELREQAAGALGVPLAAVVAEYGMTELSSQLYEATLPGAELQLLHCPGTPRPALATPRFVAPPWVRVSAVDPASLQRLPEGAPGLARFVDLANVDSAVAVVTRDRIRQQGAFIELLGRDADAPARGCSLAVDSLLGPTHGR
jgi:hypothetical protein